MKALIFIVLKITEIAGFVFIPYYIGISYAWIGKLLNTTFLLTFEKTFGDMWVLGIMGIFIPLSIILLSYVIITLNIDLSNIINRKLKNKGN